MNYCMQLLIFKIDDKEIFHFIFFRDAAHRVHPLAGLGVNLGFGDIECLDNVLTKSTLCGAKLGNFGFLLHYICMNQSVSSLRDTI